MVSSPATDPPPLTKVSQIWAGSGRSEVGAGLWTSHPTPARRAAGGIYSWGCTPQPGGGTPQARFACAADSPAALQWPIG